MLTPLQNLKAFAISRPPLVVFTACLTTFAVATLSLSYYLRTGPVHNPDIEVDWNNIMDHMSQWKLCVITPHSIPHKPWTLGESKTAQRQLSIMDIPWQRATDLKKANGSISVLLRLRLGFRAKAFLKNTDILTGEITLKDLGYDVTELNMPSLKVAIDLGAKHKLVNCTIGGYCDVTPAACVTFFGLVSLLPSVREPKTCLSRIPKDNGAIFHLQEYSNENEAMVHCSGFVILQEYIREELFEETLNYKEQTLMNMHLMYTSYFLFVMVMTVLCYAIVRGQSKPKPLLSEKAASV